MTPKHSVTFSGLPDPASFKTLVQEIPHYGRDTWHGIFKNPLFCSIARDLEQGATLVTDLDHTAYHGDAGFVLLDAAIAGNVLPAPMREAYTRLSREYESLPATRSENDKARDEFEFFCNMLLCLEGLSLTDINALSETVWHRGTPGVPPLRDAIYPEIAYLFAVAAKGAKNTQQGVVAVTASPDFAVLPGLRLLSIDPSHLCSMKLATTATGILERRFLEKVYGPSKVTAARKIFAAWDFAFGDNPRNDGAFMALACKNAIGIGPRMQPLAGKVAGEAGSRIVELLPFSKPPALL